MKKIVLVNPAREPEEFGLFKDFVPKQVPMSLGVIAGYLMKNGIEAMIFDQQVKGTDFETLIEFTENNEINVIGIGCCTAHAKETYEIARRIKQYNNSITVIVGGIHATVLPEEILNTGHVDFVVRGEGEIALGRLLDYLYSGTGLQNIPNISYWDKIRKKIIHHEISKDLIDLNELPLFPFELFEDDIDHYESGQLITSRGCPHNCIFCSQRLLGAEGYRFQEPEKTIEEINILVKKYKQKKILFSDDAFLVNKERTIKLCKLIEQQNYPGDVRFYISTRADHVTEEILMHLKRANFFQIGLGVETASERIMKMVNKKETVADNISAVNLIVRNGFRAGAAFIIGFPTETKKEIIDTIKLSYRLPLHTSKINILIPYPGTQVYNMVKDDLTPGDTWSDMVTVSGLIGRGIPYSPRGISKNQLRRLQMIGNLIFWLKFERLKCLFAYENTNQIKMLKLNSLKNLYKVFRFGLLFFIQILKNNKRKRENFS